MIRSMRLTLLAVSVAVILSCVAPIYDTARTYPGLTMGGGLAYHDVSYTSGDIDLIMSGIRPDISVGYGFTNWFSVVGRAGVLLDLESPNNSLPFAGLGVKFSTPWDVFNLGLRAEVDFPRYVSLAPMIGFSFPKGWEIATIGLETWYGIVPTTAFVSIHPLKGMHMFAGIGMPSEDHPAEVCLGLGYTYTFSRKGKEDGNEIDEE